MGVAFKKLKDALTTPPALGFLDFDRPFVFKTNDSSVTLGTVLTQAQEDDQIVSTPSCGDWVPRIFLLWQSAGMARNDEGL